MGGGMGPGMMGGGMWPGMMGGGMGMGPGMMAGCPGMMMDVDPKTRGQMMQIRGRMMKEMRADGEAGKGDRTGKVERIAIPVCGFLPRAWGS